MDNLIRSTEEHKNERKMWIAVSTLIAVVIIATAILITLTIKYREYFVFILALGSPYIIVILLGVFFFYLKYYNRKLGNTVISERESHGSHGGGYKVHKTTLMDIILSIFIAACVLLIIYTFFLLLIGGLWIFRDSDEVAPN